MPDLEDLAASITEADSVSKSDRTGASADGADPSAPSTTGGDGGGADDNAPTDFYHAVKPKPQAVPLAEVGKDEAQPEPETQRDHWVLRNWPWVAAAGGLTAVVAVLGVTQPGTVRPAQAPLEQPPTQTVSLAPIAGDRSEPPRTGRGDDTFPPAVTRTQATRPGAPVRVAYERRGNAILVPVHIGGAAGSLSAAMVFDTGATFSTLNRSSLQKVGVVPTRVTSEVETATGRVRRSLAIIERLSVGGAAVEGGLTISVCDACAATDTVGLLGLNFARHFVVTLDHEAGELVLKPKNLANAQVFDVRPFVKLLRPSSRRSQGQLTIRFSIHNRAPRPVHDLLVRAHPDRPIGGPIPQTHLSQLGAGQVHNAAIVTRAPPEERTFTLELTSAHW